MVEVGDYINSLQGEEYAISKYLHRIIINTSPKIKAKLSYGVPYYRVNYRLCFIWPSSAPYSIIKHGVQLGFCKGSLLANTQGILDMGTRKEIAIVNFTKVSEIDEQLISEILYEALAVDDMIFKERRTSLK